ncbi:MAG: hypothetical protein HYZ49_04845 [Chloroflexi bacterium]|nr:hypothetical protein [Chloroflexota bacterium]
MSRTRHHLRLWLILFLFGLAAVCVANLTLLGALSLWLPLANLPSDVIVQVCVGRVATVSWWGVWWAVPGLAAMPPPTIASRQALCGYILRPPHWAQQGSFPLLP